MTTLDQIPYDPYDDHLILYKPFDCITIDRRPFRASITQYDDQWIVSIYNPGATNNLAHRQHHYSPGNALKDAIETMDRLVREFSHA
jgi:hypothetical protein